MRKELLIFIVGAILLSPSSKVVASTYFFENTDRSERSNYDPIGSFGLGMNYVRGTINALSGSMGSTSDYADYWSADLLYGYEITDIDIVITGMSGTGMRAFASDNIIGCCSVDFGAYAQASTDGTYELTTTDPFGDIFTKGDFPLTTGHYYFGTIVPGVNASQYSYEWQITVTNASVVPLPPAVWLFLTGIFGLLSITKLKKN